MKTTLHILLLSLALGCLAGCIERPPSPRETREKFDRSHLEEILLKSAPAYAKRVGANFGDSVELMGVDWEPRVAHAGERVQVSFYFRVIDEADEDWKIFVHVDDHGGHGDRINADHWPAGRRYSTKVWRRGEVVKDTWSFNVAGNYQGEGLDLWTGFYQEGKDDRWTLTNKADVRNDGVNRVLAAMIPVAR
jgi:hypothetical protein